MPTKIILFLVIMMMSTACAPSVSVPTTTPPLTSTQEIPTTLTATPYLTSTAPAPLEPLPTIEPLPGLVFESSMTWEGSRDHKLWIIDSTGKMVFLANSEQEQNLLSSDQRWLVHIISAGSSYTHDAPQIWIEDRENKISRLLIHPENCTIDTSMISWSYDNKRLYYFVYCEKFESLRDVWFLDLSTWQTENLTNTPERGEWCISYFPNCRVSFPSLPNEILTTSYIPSTPEPLGTPLKWESDKYLTEISVDEKNYKILDTKNGIFGQQSLSPDGNSVAYDGGNILDKNGSLQTLTYSEFDTSDMPAKSIKNYIDIVNPAWSPDGTKIAWDIAHTNGSNQTKVAIFDISTQKWNTLLIFEPYWWNLVQCTCEIWNVRKLKWSPDGQWLAFGNDEFPNKEITYRGDMFYEEHSSVWIFDQNGKKMFAMYGAIDWAEPIWSPNGKWLAFTSVGRDHRFSITAVNIDEWKAYKVDLPFENVKLVNWLESK